MTAQAMERLYCNGKWWSLATLPLEEYLYCNCAPRPKGEFTTAHWRGSEGIWEIRDNRLYLVGLDLKYVSTRGKTDESSLKSGLRSAFPDCNEVFAGWYTGVLRCPEGDPVKRVRLGFASTYSRDRLIEIRDGVALGEKLQQGIPGKRYSDLGTVPDWTGITAIRRDARRIKACLSRLVRAISRKG